MFAEFCRSWEAPHEGVIEAASSHRRGRHRSSPSMAPSWGASQERQNTANMAAMGATNSVVQQSSKPANASKADKTIRKAKAINVENNPNFNEKTKSIIDSFFTD